MSQHEELKLVIRAISNDIKRRSCEIVNYSEEIDRFRYNFSAIIQGTNDQSAAKVNSAFRTAQKELGEAAKALLIAAQAGDDWCDGTQKVLKKVR